jgi:formate hydrogenlyase subunit 3/multisubunit Na+/H+ antiporter MnhD subunit
MQYLFLIGCSLFFIGAIAALLIRPIKHALSIVVVITVLALAINLIFALMRLIALPMVTDLFPVFSDHASLFRADGLALFFLLVITTVAIPTVISTYSYLQHYLHKEASVRSFLISFSLLLLSTQLLVFANHSIVFLVCWELMTLMAYLGMLLEKEKEEVQKGSFIFFTTTHMATLFLYIFFFLLHDHFGSWSFSDFHFSSSMGTIFYLVCGFGFLGFGIKAGFMPMHFWLPWAHPIAPAPLSAFLSGVIIKTGIYGIFRVIEFCSPLPVWMGIIILVVSVFSAIFGVWYALTQHDIKKLLAYHSIENIGIIGIGIGLGVLGVSYSIQSLVWLGFGGALFHTFNHAIFKTLLFLGSGVICHNCHTRDIEKMGGIVHHASWFVGLFLIGSIAISGIPPFNGFMSEFLIYKGFFNAAAALGNYFPLLMLLLSVGLAFVGGLALVCFTKINSIMFLGTERSSLQSFKVSSTEYTALGMLASLCILFGIYPQSVLGIISSVITFNHAGIIIQPYTMFTHWEFLTVIFVSVLLTIVCVVLWKKFNTNQRISQAWGCGYTALTPRMQYTASSYADEINSIASQTLHLEKHVTAPKTLFPQPSHFVSHAEDFSEKRFIAPMYKYIMNKIDSFEFLSRTDIRFYISFMLIMAIIYGGIAIVWPH